MAISFVNNITLAPGFTDLGVASSDFFALTFFPPPGIPVPPPLARIFYTYCALDPAAPNFCFPVQLVYPAFVPSTGAWGGALVLPKPVNAESEKLRCFARTDTLIGVIADVFIGDFSDLA